jgi:hypothetical protein
MFKGGLLLRLSWRPEGPTAWMRLAISPAPAEEAADPEIVSEMTLWK